MFPRAIEEVLLEYEGPQLVVKRDDAGTRYLALAVDDDPRFVRWVEAPISPLELRAIKLGALPLRDAFLKGAVTIADYTRDTNSPISARDATGTELPDTALPPPGLVLDLEADEDDVPILARPAVPAFHFQGDGPVPNSIRFGQLIAAAQTIQEFWNTAAQSIFQTTASILYAAVPQEGSWTIPIHTDDLALFERVASRYQKMTMAAGDETTLRAALSSEPPAVALSFEKHLQAVEMQSLEVLTQWRGGAAFIGHQTAHRARQSFPGTGEVHGESASVPKTFRGYFDNFWRSGQRQHAFDFYDIDTGRMIFGAFGPEFRKRAQAPDFSLTIGRTAREYRIDTMEEQSDPPKYTLTDIHS